MPAPPISRILYDHEWVKGYVRSAIEAAARDLARLQGEAAPRPSDSYRAEYMVDLDRRTPRR